MKEQEHEIAGSRESLKKKIPLPFYQRLHVYAAINQRAPTGDP
jgi:hypothetical protein